uniref:Uncharacterized protein n=1 Tax=Solanum lycopersicum TaxID=4081 RepID=A0A3Q7G6V1_SOLLC
MVTVVAIQKSNLWIHCSSATLDESILQKFWKLCYRQLNIPGGFALPEEEGYEIVNETHEKMKVLVLPRPQTDLLLCRHLFVPQDFKSSVFLVKEAFSQNCEKEARRMLSWSNVQLSLLKDGDDEYSLLVDLNRLYELQLSRKISIERLHKDLAEILKNFRSIDDELCVVFSEQLNNGGCFRKATLASTEIFGFNPDEYILQKFWKLC